MIELLAVVAIVTILASLLLPALSEARQKAYGISCRNNMRQLQLAWFLYKEDNEDQLVLNNNLQGTTWTSGDMSNPQQAGNPEVLERGLLFSYTENVKIYRCPSDNSTLGGDQRIRSYALSCQMNGRNLSGPDFPVNRGFSDIVYPPPSMAFVFIDEHPLTIADGAFGARAEGSEWFSFPATRHSRGANLSFADGHVEFWKWKDPRTLSLTKASRVTPDNPDLQRIQDALATKR